MLVYPLSSIIGFGLGVFHNMGEEKVEPYVNGCERDLLETGEGGGRDGKGEREGEGEGGEGKGQNLGGRIWLMRFNHERSSSVMERTTTYKVRKQRVLWNRISC
jgi:hypothetical protein